MTLSRRLPLLLLAILALAVPATADAAKRKTTYLVSLGDSYAQGFQAIGPGMASVPTKKGYVNALHRRLRKSNPGLKLVQLGCGGATTGSMINGTRPCSEKLPYKSRSKATSQLTYAKKWLRKHRKRVRFVTVIIGGNDVAPCASRGDNAAIIACVGEGINEIKKNLPVIAKGVRGAAGRKAIIVGSTYPNVVLGQWVKSENGKQLAKLSVEVFRKQINPALRNAYKKRKIAFVDATKGFGGYIPFEKTTMTERFGEIPKAVANICRFAWYCEPRDQGPDIHLKTSGYTKLAKLVHAVIRKQQR